MIGGLVSLFILFNLNTIALTIAIIKSAAMFIYQTIFIVFTPLIFFVLIFAYIAFWLCVLIYLYSIG